MTNVLLFEKNEQHCAKIQEMLSRRSKARYELTCESEFSRELFENAIFDIILVLQGDDTGSSKGSPSDLNIVKNIVHLELSAPIIIISSNIDSSTDDELMAIGVADSIPLDELSGTLLDRTIRHAIGRKNTEAKLSFLATHDQLTGLANRYLFHEHLAHSIDMAKRNQSIFGLLFLDLDRFKSVNDSHGHDVGDMLLIQVANRIREAVRESDIVARIGGDEFTVLVGDCNHQEELAVIAAKIQKAVEPVIQIRDHDLYVTASIGIAYFPECGLLPQTLMKSADIALYRAKDFGRNIYQFFTNELNEQTRLKLELEKSLRRAMVRGEFEIYFQPQVRASDQGVCGAEALLRWNHPSIGVVSPDEFIPLLEELGLMVRVEQWVIKQVCEKAKSITDKYGKLRFAINISGSHFKHGDLKQSIYLALQESSLDASYLEIELTEDIMIEHIERNSDILTELAEIGISIALDDFGKGYSSLSYLKNFPAAILKIDRSFIRNMLSDKRDSSIVEAMVNLSHQLGLKVVAEGVEETRQVDFLQQKKCDYIQGFLFAKPMPIDQFDSYLHNQLVKTPRIAHIQSHL